MPVTDAQVAALRAQLAGHLEEHLRMLDKLDSRPDRRAYSALVVASFCEAAERRFGRDSTPAAVVEFVADIRATSDEASRKIDPRTAERLIRAVYTDEDVSDIGADTKKELYVLLLPALAGDLQLAEDELDEFLANSRSLADQWLS